MFDFFRDYFEEVRLGRILLISLAIVVIAVISNFVFYFLATLVWHQRNQLNTAILVSTWSSFLLILLLTLLAGMWEGSKVRKETGLSGIILGICVGAILFFLTRGFGTPLSSATVTLVLTMAMGFIGGVIAGYRRREPVTEEPDRSKLPYR